MWELLPVETLPNGVQVYKRTSFTSASESEFPWVSVMNMGGWHYSQHGTTRESAIENLFIYMRRLKSQFEEDLKRDTVRLEVLNQFLETHEN